MGLLRGGRYRGILEGGQMGAELRDKNGSGPGDGSGEFRELGEAAFAVVCLDRLLQGSDVPEGQQEQDHQVPFVFYRRYLEKQP